VATAAGVPPREARSVWRWRISTRYDEVGIERQLSVSYLMCTEPRSPSSTGLPFAAHRLLAANDSVRLGVFGFATGSTFHFLFLITAFCSSEGAPLLAELPIFTVLLWIFSGLFHGSSLPSAVNEAADDQRPEAPRCGLRLFCWHFAPDFTAPRFFLLPVLLVATL
jgi:hypothetical protein